MITRSTSGPSATTTVRSMREPLGFRPVGERHGLRAVIADDRAQRRRPIGQQPRHGVLGRIGARGVEDIQRGDAAIDQLPGDRQPDRAGADQPDPVVAAFWSGSRAVQQPGLVQPMQQPGHLRSGQARGPAGRFEVGHRVVPVEGAEQLAERGAGEHQGGTRIEADLELRSRPQNHRCCRCQLGTAQGRRRCRSDHAVMIAVPAAGAAAIHRPICPDFSGPGMGQGRSGDRP